MNLYEFCGNNSVNTIDPWGWSSGELWYDRWSRWLAEGAESTRSNVNDTYPWYVAGALNSVVDLGVGVLDTPYSIGHLGEATGRFTVCRTWENALGTVGDLATIASVVGMTGSALAAKPKITPKTGGEYLNETWHKGTFPNKTQSVKYHLGKHGKGRTASQYTQDAMKFFDKNKHLGQKVILKDGTPGIKIQTKVKVPGQKTQRIGGYWTENSKLVTFWD